MQIGIAANRTGEVTIVPAGECKVTFIGGCVYGLGHGSQYGHVDRFRCGLAAHRFEQALQVFMAGVLGKTQSKSAHEAAKILDGLRFGRWMKIYHGPVECPNKQPKAEQKAGAV